MRFSRFALLVAMAVTVVVAPLRPAWAQGEPKPGIKNAYQPPPLGVYPADDKPPAPGSVVDPAAARPAEPVPPAVPLEVLDPEAEPPAQAQQRRRRWKRAAIALAIIGAAGIGAGIGLGIASKQNYDDFDTEIRMKLAGKMLAPGVKPSDDANASRLTAERYGWGGVVTGVVGFVALDIAAFIWWFKLRGESSSSGSGGVRASGAGGAVSSQAAPVVPGGLERLQVSPMPGGARASLSWRF
jgi:hypothetical protein